MGRLGYRCYVYHHADCIQDSRQRWKRIDDLTGIFEPKKRHQVDHKAEAFLPPDSPWG